MSNHTDKGDRGSLGDIMSSIGTPGVKNMEAAWSRAGASAHHTPAHATKLGSQDQIGANESGFGVGSNVGGKKTVGNGGLAKQSDEPTAFGAMVNNLINGDKTK